MAENPENVLHMLNPYKFATWQFMKQYFSVSPSMYLNYTNTGTSDSYNKLFYKLIMPFEPKFETTTGDLSHTTNLDGHECTTEWAYNNIPKRYCLQRDFHNFRKPNELNYDKRILSGNNYISATDKGTFENGGSVYEGDQTNYFYPYHGGIFAAVIPIFTLNRVIKHREIYWDSALSQPVASPNFFSTYTRTAYPQGSFAAYLNGNTTSVDSGVSLTSDPPEYNLIFANSGTRSQFIGTRTCDADGATYTYNMYEQFQYSNDMNFTSPGYTTASNNISAFKVLNQIMNNSFSYPTDVTEIETDMIYGMSTHSNTHTRNF